MERPSKAELEQIRLHMSNRDLAGLPGFEQYEQESHFTLPWQCDCGTHACSEACCASCGSTRPAGNHDSEQGETGHGIMRDLSGKRKGEKGKNISLDALLEATLDLEIAEEQLPPLYE